MKLRILALGLVLALTGCWKQVSGGRYLHPDYPNQHVITLAVLPVLNLTEQRFAVDSVQTALFRQLRYEKKYEVQPTSRTMALLRVGGGGAAYSRMMQRVGVGEQPDNDALEAIARALEVDGLFQETILSYHAFREDGIGPTSGGAASYTQFPVAVVEVRGMLWGAHGGDVLWRDEATVRHYTDPVTEGVGSYAKPVELATRQLLGRFPENVWAPKTPPTPTPVPQPVTSYVPFPTPADPNP